MSSSNESTQVTLNVETGDESAEVFVIDGRFKLAGRGVGQYLTFGLDPGLYKVQVMVGSVTREEQVALLPGSTPTLKEFAPARFESPAPLLDTAKTHEFHIAAAQSNSRVVHFHAGSGSWVFVCARGWTEKIRTDSATYERPHPAQGLKLLNESGETVVDLETQSAKNLGWEPWAACNVSVAPGNYRLRLEVPSLGRTVEQTVVASPGWQTQIFLLQRDYSEDTQEAGRRGGSDLRADLLGASVLMSRHDQPPLDFDPASPPGFDPDRRDLRLVETARLALTNQRKILSEDLRQMLRYKFENPMLGIFGAHLLLLEKEPDMGLIRVVVTNLRRMVGHAHPDVEALALKIEEQTDYSFKMPPLLQRSWSLIWQATADRSELVAEDSLLSAVAQCWWGDSIWLTWLTPEAEGGLESVEDATGTDADELSDLEAVILMKIKAARRGRRRRARSRSASIARDISNIAVPEDAGGAQESKGLESMSTEDASTEDASSEAADDPSSAEDDVSSDVQSISSETIRKLTLQLGIPRAAVEKSIRGLGQKALTRKL